MIYYHQSFHTPTTEFGKNIFKKEISSVEYFLTQRKKGLPNYNIDWYNNSQGSCEYLLSRQLSPYTKQHKSNFNKFPAMVIISMHMNLVIVFVIIFHLTDIQK